ncbi:hypothetical protein BH09PSE1_BH09PSE1_01830 [soil metagenome]
MIKFYHASALVLGALAIAACNPQAAAPQSESAEATPPPPAMEPAMAQTAYSASEMKMHDAMMAANGADVSEVWARKMIPHHQGAVDMSQVVLRDGTNPDIRRMAQKTIEMQTRDIAELQRWLQGRPSGGADPSAQTAFMPVETRMKDAMMAASVADADHLWARKMIAHHQGAIEMSRVVIAGDPDAAIRTMAQKTIDMQGGEIREMEAWLAAHPMSPAG